MGFKFSTYATYWIKQAISSFLVANKGAPSTPSHVRIAYNKLLKEAKKNDIGLKELVAQCRPFRRF
jgi:DNA-directed RNA polymerase sigma subunit (sigma70/sigma32)